MTCEPPSGREFIFNKANWNTEHRRIIIFNTAQCTSKMQPNTMKLNFFVILSQWFHSALPLLAQVCPTMNLVADTLAWQNIYWLTWWLTNQHYNNNNNNNNEKALRDMQTLCAGCSKLKPKIFAPPQRPILGGVGQPKFNQLETVTTFTYKPSLARSMHIISSYHGNRPTNKPTQKIQDR